MAKEYTKGFYQSRPWRKCKNSYLSSINYLCERCLVNGNYSKATIVHHKEYITPMNINNPNVTLNHDNLEGLCQTCHNREHHERHGVTAWGLSFDENGNLIKKDT